ncbi:DUF6515 family protein [Rubidibacter lacunae]|uniref:DUF6515 family protein n=1 Tax=Rubidibacter lacunae TaxID=582514 RepID=UPI0004099B1C|nr:DUF6515 family protein [Rubidibacter lacunae]
MKDRGNVNRGDRRTDSRPNAGDRERQQNRSENRQKLSDSQRRELENRRDRARDDQRSDIEDRRRDLENQRDQARDDRRSDIEDRRRDIENRRDQAWDDRRSDIEDLRRDIDRDIDIDIDRDIDFDRDRWRGGGWYGGGYYVPPGWGWGAAALTAGLVIGSAVSSAPPYYETVYVGSTPYIYSDGIYFEPSSNDDYIVVAPPTGATVPYLPDGCEGFFLEEDQFYDCSGIYYQPVLLDGSSAYVVIEL